MLAAQGCRPIAGWRFDLYGGTVLLAASRAADDRTGPSGPAGPAGPDDRTGASGPDDRTGPADVVAELLADEASAGVRDPAVLRGLEARAHATATNLRDWLSAQRAAGRRVLGYGAASRAVALLGKAGVDRQLLPAIADASSAKHGLRMPGSDIPVVSPAQIASAPPDFVLLFVSDLRAEVTAAYPEVEASGGTWVDADSLPPPATGPI